MLDAELVEQGLDPRGGAMLLEPELRVSMEVAPDLHHPGQDGARRLEQIARPAVREHSAPRGWRPIRCRHAAERSKGRRATKGRARVGGVSMRSR